MPNSNVIVAGIAKVDPPLQTPVVTFLRTAPHPVTVHFDNGRTAKLSSKDALSAHYAEVIDELRRMIIPAYVEVDPTTQTITRLLIPLVVTVSSVTPNSTGDAEVTLEISHSRHVLRAAQPDYKQILAQLRDAQENGTTVMVTENEQHEIIDVRPSPHPNQPAAIGAPRVTLELAKPSLRSVTPDRARELFALMLLQSCDPITVPPPCIPFLYPDDGCWGRAHQMCRLMIGAGEQPAKVWIYGHLIVHTRNNPSCEVAWGWHVAPTLQVATGGSTEIQVIDPSLFTDPAPESKWNGVQGDAHAVLAHTDAGAFYRAADGKIQLDPDYSQTAQVLARYRLQLKLRSASAVGPPPYGNCAAVV